MTNKFMVTFFCAGLPNYPITGQIPPEDLQYKTNGLHQEGYFEKTTGGTRIAVLTNGVTVVECGVHLSIIADTEQDIEDFSERYELDPLRKIIVKEYKIATE